MNVKAAARGGADSGGGEQSDERGPFSFLFVPKTAVAQHVMMVPITSGRHTAANANVRKIPLV